MALSVQLVHLCCALKTMTLQYSTVTIDKVNSTIKMTSIAQKQNVHIAT